MEAGLSKRLAIGLTALLLVAILSFLAWGGYVIDKAIGDQRDRIERKLNEAVGQRDRMEELLNRIAEKLHVR